MADRHSKRTVIDRSVSSTESDNRINSSDLAAEMHATSTGVMRAILTDETRVTSTGESVRRNKSAGPRLNSRGTGPRPSDRSRRGRPTC